MRLSNSRIDSPSINAIADLIILNILEIVKNSQHNAFLSNIFKVLDSSKKKTGRYVKLYRTYAQNQVDIMKSGRILTF